MTVFQTPTYQVIISNLGWCFFVENSVETFKDVAKFNICEKKEKAIFHCQRKKNKPFFLKICVKYFVQKTKRTLLKTSCSKKKCCFFWFTKRKRKTRLWCRTFWLICKILLILFKAKFAYCQKQNREHLPLEEKQARFFFVFFRVVFSSK